MWLAPTVLASSFSFYPGVLHTRVQRPSLSLILHFQLTCYVLPTYNSHLLTKFSFQDWMDYQLHWNVTEYGGVESIRIHPKLIWTPDLLMYNRWVLRCCKMQICICFVFEYGVVWGGGLNRAICSCGVCLKHSTGGCVSIALGGCVSIALGGVLA